jgi:hypothetical protein
MTIGFTFGALLSFLPPKLTKHSQVTHRLNQFSDDCGKPLVKRSTIFFFWLALIDRLSTRDMIRRRGMHLDDYQCVLCQNSTEETVMHLLFYCPFAKDCWSWMDFHFADHLSIQQIFLAWKSPLKVEFSLDIFILLCWAIWMTRNDVVFRNMNPSVQDCKRHLTVETVVSA